MGARGWSASLAPWTLWTTWRSGTASSWTPRWDDTTERSRGSGQLLYCFQIIYQNHSGFEQRIYILLRTDSTPPCHLKLSCLTQPLPACLVGSYTDRQSKERLLNLRRRGDRILSVLSRIYSIFFGFEAAIKQLC